MRICDLSHKITLSYPLNPSVVPVISTCPACPVAPGDGTGVAQIDGTGVKFTIVRALRISLGRLTINCPRSA